ncbi:RNA polymerase II-associated factor 1 homolog [Caenorhabditis elegans]|nr:RNA polymerase II-associated factor 1 homolog [Caenorhabditis elegans]CCD63417.1 RNA polymerase II-associated factor 1 homolog [Caenorhabditis elegans]|eukprot:NP_001041252.1 Uncharacterized protein CELE_F43B10.2 [Caenorhabditis elegans]
MSVNQFDSFMEKVQETTPITISGLPFVDDGIYGVQESGQNSSRSSVYSSSKSTVIEVEQSSRQQQVGRPTESPPLPPPPLPLSNPPAKPTPPPPPPKPTIRPPPIPASPPPRPPASEPVGIPLYSEKQHQQQLRPTTAVSPPKPPSFAPPVPPAAALITDTSTTTNALTNAMFEQLKQSSVRYDYVPYKSDHRSFTQNTQPSPLPPAGVGDRRHSVPDDVRHYADETTPPPVLHDVADRYSTVAYMNHEPTHNSTRVYSHSPTRSQVGVRDAHRLSRDDLRVVDAQSSPADSQSEELRRMYSGRSGNSVKPTGDVTARYVYDTANRNYTAYGERQARESYTSFTNNDRKRWSRSSEPRSETYINDPYYSGKDVVSGYGVIETRRSRTSLHSHGSVPELIHSENKYDYQQLTDQQNREMERKSRLDTERRSRRQSEGSRQIYIDRQISPERQRKDQYSGTYTNVNMQDNPQYSIRREVPPPVIPPKPQVVPHVQRVNGGEVYEDERSIYEAYSQIQHQRPQPPIYGGQTLQPIPPPPQPQPIPQQYPPRYDQVPDQSISNHYIIPKSMRGSSSPILVRVQLSSKSPDSVRRQVQPQPQPQPQQQQQYEAYGEADYVSRNLPLGVTEETTTTTTTTRNEEIERKRRKKKEEEDRKKSEEIYVPYNNGEQDYDRYNNYRDAENALIEEEYNTRHLKRTTEHPHRKQPPQKRDNTKDQHRGGKKSSHHHSRETKHRIGWSPSNYRNPRDCFLNLLCFIIAPLVIILILVVIIVFVIIQ